MMCAIAEKHGCRKFTEGDGCEAYTTHGVEFRNKRNHCPISEQPKKASHAPTHKRVGQQKTAKKKK